MSGTTRDAKDLLWTPASGSAESQSLRGAHEPAADGAPQAGLLAAGQLEDGRLEGARPGDGPLGDAAERYEAERRQDGGRSDDFAGLLVELSTILVRDDDVEAALRHVVVLATKAIEGCTAAGVTLLDAGRRPTTAASSHEETLEVDQAQYAVGDGPCLDAFEHLRINRVDVEEAAARWPRFAAAARRLGIRSFLAAPLVVGETPLGSLNLYGHDAHAFDALDEPLLALFSAQASAVISSVRRYGEARSLVGQMEAALASRAVIEQAKGVLVALVGCDSEAAFDLMREWSQRSNTKLREVAGTLVRHASDGEVLRLLDQAGVVRRAAP